VIYKYKSVDLKIGVNRSKDILSGSYLLENNNSHNSSKTIVKPEAPDVVAVWELVKSTALQLSQAFDLDFPYQLISPAFEFGIFSKYSLRSGQLSGLEPQVGKCQEFSYQYQNFKLDNLVY
jgi:hypothetical protein